MRAGAPVVLALATVLVVLPFGAGFPLTDDPSPHFRALPVLDLALLAVIVATLPILASGVRARALAPGAALWMAAVSLLAISFAFQPSVIGAQTVFRLIGALAIAIAVASLRGDERVLITGLLGAVAVAETVVAILQVVTGAPLGLMGEVPTPLDHHGDVLIPRGTMLVDYLLTGLAVVAAGLAVREAAVSRAPVPWLVLAAAAVAPVGMSFSRGAALGLIAGCVALASSARSLGRWAVAALLLGAALPALALAGGWAVRAEEGLTVSSRDRLTAEALVVVAEHPVLGVGPGRYVAAATERFPGVPSTHAVHDVPLMIAAEGGIPAGVAAGALVVVLGWRALRAGRETLALYLLFVPFFLVDVFPYVAAQGIVLTGLWIGALDASGPPARVPRR